MTIASSVTSRRPHVVFLNRSFWPDTEATGQLLTELAADLTRWFDVTVIVGTPNHVEQGTSKTYLEVDQYHGVAIRRVWHSQFHKHSSFGRMANLTTFAMSAWSATCRLRRAPDVIVVETDPFFLPLVGRRLQRRFSGSSLVCYLQDLYPDIAVAVGRVREGFVTRTLRKLLFDVYREANRVIVLSRDMKQRCESHGVPRGKLEVVSNWMDTETVQPIKNDNEFRRSHGLVDKFVVMYSGNMGLAHELDSLLEAAAILRDRTDIEWVLIGDGARRQSLQAKAETLGLSRVRFLPYQPRNELAQSLSAADVQIVSISAGASACVMPSKIYGILASGTATVALTERGTELYDLIHEHEVGFTCQPGDWQSLTERIQQLADDARLTRQLGQNARKLAESSYHRAGQTTRIAEILFDVLGKDAATEINGQSQTVAATSYAATA